MANNPIYNNIKPRICSASCEYSDGLCYTSNPSQCKCNITGEYYYIGNYCDITQEQLSEYKNKIYANKEKDTKVGSITVKGFNSLIETLKLLIDNDYKILIKKEGSNKYNETTHFIVEYYTEGKIENQEAKEAYQNYLVEKAISDSINKNSTKLNTITNTNKNKSIEGIVSIPRGLV